MKRFTVRLFIVGVFITALYGLASVKELDIPIIDRAFSYIVYPFLKFQEAFTEPFKQARKKFNLFRDLEALSSFYALYQEDLIKEHIELAALAETYKEVQELIDFRKRYTSSLCTTQVIARSFSPSAHTFIIDAGLNRGVAVDMVAVYKNCLVGRVTKVYPRYSYVTLITDPACKVAAYCKEARNQGIHTGQAKLTQTSLTHVLDPEHDLEKRIKKGDLVMSSGQGLIFPKGFALGTVSSWTHEEYTCAISVTPLLNFRELSYCSIIAQGAEYTEEQSAP